VLHAHGADEAVAGGLGGAEQFVGNGVEHELGPPEHLEVVGVIDGAPAQVQEPVAALAVDERAALVEGAVLRDGVDGEVPFGVGCVAGDQVGPLV